MRIYLDYASTSPIDKKVLKAMLPYLGSKFANASSLYKEGVEIKKVIDACRKSMADILHTVPAAITFTGSGTEANNIAILGTFYKFNKEFKKNSYSFAPHFITSSIEHPAVLEPMRAIERMGAEVTYIEPEHDGHIDPKKVKAAMKENTVFVSIMYANNEIGTVNPIKEIAKVVRRFRQEQSELGKNKKKHSLLPYFHSDASQAANYLDLNVASLNIDMMTLDASKMYGPKGVGMLFCKPTIEIEAIMYGGSQEKGIRPGTEATAQIVGLSESLKIAISLREKESQRLKLLQEYFFSELLSLFPYVVINGSREKRLPNNVNFCIPRLDAEYAVFLLDAAGICVSSVTSCRNLSEESDSYVVAALNPETSSQCSRSSLRFSMGRDTTKKDIQTALKILKQIIDKALIE